MCKGKILSQEDQGCKNSLKINSQKIRLPELDFVPRKQKGCSYIGKNIFEEGYNNTVLLQMSFRYLKRIYMFAEC
jgi:hypothetical protein